MRSIASLGLVATVTGSLLGATGPAHAGPLDPSDGAVIVAHVGGTSKDRCRVTPLTPKVLPHLDELGRKVVRYPVAWTCEGDRKLEVRQRAYEQDKGDPGDAGDSDLLASWNWWWKEAKPFAKTINPTKYVGNWDTGTTPVELYHEVSFRVLSNGVEGSWTPFQKSSVISVTP